MVTYWPTFEQPDANVNWNDPRNLADVFQQELPNLGAAPGNAGVGDGFGGMWALLNALNRGPAPEAGPTRQLRPAYNPQPLPNPAAMGMGLAMNGIANFGNNLTSAVNQGFGLANAINSSSPVAVENAKTRRLAMLAPLFNNLFGGSGGTSGMRGVQSDFGQGAVLPPQFMPAGAFRKG